MITIRPYRPQHDQAAVFALWQAALGQVWPLTEAGFQATTVGASSYRDGDHLVAVLNDAIVGFVATQLNHDTPGPASLPVIYVAPQVQRQGIGTALHAAALAHVRGLGATGAFLGGGENRFWPGVPDNLPAARPFFEACGWKFAEPCYDLVQRTRDYRSPDDLVSGVIFELATPEAMPELMVLQEREFPQWSAAFPFIANLGDYADLLIARDQTSHAIIGALILFTEHSHPSRTDVLWTELLGAHAGALGCVGVAEAVNGRGIGTALVGHGSEILKKRGVDSVYVSWVYRVNFYGRLGYSTWRTYDVSWRDL